jgi:hypothetical protein
VAKIGLHLIEKMGNYMPVGGNGETSGKRAAAVSTSRQDSRPEKKLRREEGIEDDRVPIRTSRSKIWKERGRGGGRSRGGGGNSPRGGMYTGGRGGHNPGRNSESSGYGGQAAGFNNRQRDGYYYTGFSGRGPKGGGGSGYRGRQYRGRQYRGGADRWGHPY